MGIPTAPSFSICCETASEACFPALLWSRRRQQCQQSNLIAFALAIPLSRNFPGLCLTLLAEQSCRGQPAELTLASRGLQGFPALGSSLGNPEGQVISIVSSPPTWKASQSPGCQHPLCGTSGPHVDCYWLLGAKPYRIDPPFLLGHSPGGISLSSFSPSSDVSQGRSH